MSPFRDSLPHDVYLVVFSILHSLRGHWLQLEPIHRIIRIMILDKGSEELCTLSKHHGIFIHLTSCVLVAKWPP